MTGISLRNWFAGQALAGLLAGSPTFLGKPDIPRALAVSAFQLADAMLAHAQPEPEPASVNAELLAAAKALAEEVGRLPFRPPFTALSGLHRAALAAIARAEGRAND